MQEKYNRRTFIKTGAILGAGLAASGALARSAAPFRSTDPFLGQIAIVSFNFAPKGWALCSGQLLRIDQNQPLFALLGNTYGGDGRVNFALPDFRGRTPIHAGNGYVVGQQPGTVQHTLTETQLPNHQHSAKSGSEAANITLAVGETADSTDPEGNYLAANPTWADRFYPHPDDSMGQAQPFPSGAIGGGQAHENRMPFLALNFIVALNGVFPTLEISEPDAFVGEIRMVPYNNDTFIPEGWAECNGQLLPLSQHTVLFSLLGTTYGGDGESDFALPDLRGRVPMHPGQGPGLSPRYLGETGGEETVTLLESEIPSHLHTVEPQLPVGVSANTDNPVRAYFAPTEEDAYSTSPSPGEVVTFKSQLEAEPAGSDQPHNNMQPSLVMKFIIALEGVFPPRS